MYYVLPNYMIAYLDEDTVANELPLLFRVTYTSSYYPHDE